MNFPLLTDAELRVAVSGVGAEQRVLDARRVAVAGELHARPEMVQSAGFNRSAAMLAEVWGVSFASAQRLVDVGAVA